MGGERDENVRKGNDRTCQRLLSEWVYIDFENARETLQSIKKEMEVGDGVETREKQRTSARQTHTGCGRKWAVML